MDDRFRFRAWNKIKKVMYTGLPFSNAGEKGVDDFKQILKHPTIYEVMQCTRLKDKNDQLIFEGDIVKNKIAIGVVKFGNPDLFKDSMCSMFYWEMIKQLDSCEFCFEDDIFTEFKDCEIIGNIYENPELMEV